VEKKASNIRYGIKTTDGSKKQVIKYIDSEKNAVTSKSGENPYADFALLFHVNIGKFKYNKNDFSEIEKHLGKLQSKNPKTVYVYLESYHDKGTEPRFILKP
jgi:hypothetical protein